MDDGWSVMSVLRSREGKFLLSIGPNGGGKSTTVKTLIGLIQPNEGYVTRRDRVTIGYVPQSLSIDWTLPLTVKRLMTLTCHAKHQDIFSALERVGIVDHIDKQVQNLSGGEFQRALLARALIRKPDVLVLDEPVQGVDFTGMIALYELIEKLRDDLNCGILLISHDLHVVMAKTDKVICLNGHICCSGPPESVVEHQEYRRLFGETASQTLSIYKHKHDHIHGNDGEIIHTGSSCKFSGDDHD